MEKLPPLIVGLVVVLGIAGESGKPRADRYLHRLNDVVSYLAQ
jgi:hypothetical protein